MATTVFDVAAEFIQRSGGQPMSTVKLQKLCFFAFGWYAHLTGESLFPEPFYAMEHGPVVGELLSAHAGETVVGLDRLAAQMTERDGSLTPLDPYAAKVVDAVWDFYGRLDAWKLVEKTHSEDVWRQSWERRPQGSKRGTMSQTDITSYFVARTTRPEEHLDLPPSAVSFLSDDDLRQIEEQAKPCSTFVDAVRSLASV